MRFGSLSAVAHPAGNRIDLMWVFPGGGALEGVRVVRREGSHPTSPDDGVVVADGLHITAATDAGLKGETVYYYALFGYAGDPREYDIDRRNRVAAMATSPYDHAGQMFSQLPVIYHRYDTRLPETVPPMMAEADRQRGQLRRFLELPGAQLDLLHSFAKAALDLYDVDRVHGNLLPLLAGWIGWKTDYRMEIESQRNEIRNAPFLYRTIGLKRTIEATVKRVTRWESRTKEFVHNVCRSNTPERLNLWITHSKGVEWSQSSELLSLDYAYDGRPAALRDSGGRLWLFHHTRANGRWEIRAKRHDATGWGESQPLPHAARTDNRQPAAALAGGNPWVFWIERSETMGNVNLVSSIWNGTRWSTPSAPEIDANDPREPAAFVDHLGHAWLFWLERMSEGRRLRYARHDGTDWGAPVTFPLDAGIDPRVEAEPFVLFDPAAIRIWVLWSRETLLASNQTRREIAWRVKANADFDDAGWSAVRTLPRPPLADYHDREPAARLSDGGQLEIFFSSNRGTSGYGVWRSVLTDEGANTWEAPQPISEGPYTQRAPLALSADGDTWLIFRSNESVSYTSALYGATFSTDFRYAGSTTIDTRHEAKNALRGAFEDFGTYTYDAGRDDRDWYARDTAGLYLEPDTLDAANITAGIDRLRGVLGEFMPMTDRAVFITAGERLDDRVYTYDAPDAATPRFIIETYSDALAVVSEDAAFSAGEEFSDVLE